MMFLIYYGNSLSRKLFISVQGNLILFDNFYIQVFWNSYYMLENRVQLSHFVVVMLFQYSILFYIQSTFLDLPALAFIPAFDLKKKRQLYNNILNFQELSYFKLQYSSFFIALFPHFIERMTSLDILCAVLIFFFITFFCLFVSVCFVLSLWRLSNIW